jgi:uncharacterized protein
MFLIQNADQWLLTLAAFPSLLKILIFLGTWLGVWLPLGVVIALLIKWQGGQPFTADYKLVFVGTLYLVSLLICWGTVQIEQTSPINYGWNWGFGLGLEIALGCLIGVIGIGLLVAIELAGGWIEWQDEKALGLEKIILPTLAIALLISTVEELIFRGIFINILQQDYSLWAAAAISSAIFALLHLVWERKETLPQVPGLWLMGMVLVAARVANQGNLGLAIGLHTGWIVAIATLDTAQLIKYPDPLNSLVVGRYGKPLAGIMGIVLLLCTGLALQVIKL